MINIYLIRHAECEDNVTHLVPRNNSPLSNKGIREAKLVAKKLKRLDLNAIFTSDQERALHTARIISKTSQIKVIKSKDLRERKFPRKILGKSEEDETARIILQEMTLNSSDPKWHYSNEENFAEWKIRTINAIKVLSKEKNKNIAVVTHAGFIRMTLCFIKHGANFSEKNYNKLRQENKIKSASLTWVKITDKGGLKLFSQPFA